MDACERARLDGGLLVSQLLFEFQPRAMGARYEDIGVVTTPQLHYVVRSVR